MIKITKMNGENIYLNAELIESVQSRPDTLITLTTGNKIMVKEEVSQVIERIREYRKEINAAAIKKLTDNIMEENQQ